jgi:hypothetical protein
MTRCVLFGLTLLVIASLVVSPGCSSEGASDTRSGSVPDQQTSRNWATVTNDAGRTPSGFAVESPPDTTMSSTPDTTTSGTSNCCYEHDSPGCVDPECSTEVCGYDAYCCQDAWTDECAYAAGLVCPECGESR